VVVAAVTVSAARLTEPPTGWFHVRKTDLHGRSARDVDPPFESFDVVLRRDYDALLALVTQLHDALDAVKGNVYLYRIEHLTPETCIKGIEDALAVVSSGGPEQETT
jgi:hypothetical protein